MLTWIGIALLSFILSTVSLDLPRGHTSVYFHRKNLSSVQAETQSGPTCYGYESNCEQNSRFAPLMPHSCEEKESWKFWNQGDFGYIRKRLDEMTSICRSEYSSLECTGRLGFCKAQNLFLDLRNSRARNWPEFIKDVFDQQQVGGNCEVDMEAILQHNAEPLNGGLFSWYSELKNFSKVNKSAEMESQCDLIINKPVVFMKLDQGENMYHHMCDFFNLYISLHVNGSIEFNTDILIVHWHWLERSYIDLFKESWKAFTQHPVTDIKQWFGKRVCVRNGIFSFLPRMVFGLFYNTPLVHNCWGSGLVKSFSQFLLHRMKIKQVRQKTEIIRITFLTRRSYDSLVRGKRVMYRKIMNEALLIEVMNTLPGVKVKVVEYKQDQMTFHDQLTVTSNTDIFIAIHGAGLTHLVFLPDWAIVFELYDCEAKCFKDLARLRGIRHMTWHDSSKMTKHKRNVKFQENNPRYHDFSFDPEEFKRLLLVATNQLKEPTLDHTEL